MRQHWLANINFSCSSGLMANMHLEVSESVFIHLMHHLAISNLIWLTMRDFLFLDDILVLSQMFKSIINVDMYCIVKKPPVPDVSCSISIYIAIYKFILEYSKKFRLNLLHSPDK